MNEKRCDEIEMFSHECADELLDPEGCTAFIDKCLTEEVKGLWADGIMTMACCCGHGNRGVACIMPATEEDEKKMVELGYVVSEGNACIDSKGIHLGYQPKSVMKYEKEN